MLPTDADPTHDSPLEIRILDGDVAGVMDLVDAMTPAERAAIRPAIERLVFSRWRMAKQGGDKSAANRLSRAIDMARFMCSTEHPQADYWLHIGVQDIAAFRRRYQPGPSAEHIDKQLRGEHGWHYRHNIHRAVIAGLVERPQTDDYIQALFFGDLRAESNVILKHVDADPGMAPWLLRLFEHEGTSDGSFAAVEKYCHDPELLWSQAFTTLCERGVYTRAQLLDKTLGALACDWPQFKSGWFSRFHEILSPTVEEMLPFADRYLALCHSRIAPTVGLALEAVAQLHKAGHVDEDAVCEALQPVITSSAKARVLAALDLLGQLVKKAPARATAASAIAAHALAHSGADVQKKAISCLKSWGLDAAGQDIARGYLTFVSAVNRPALAALVGRADEAPHAASGGATPAALTPATQPSPAPSAWLSPLDASRVLQPLTHIPDLIERMAYALENPADVDEWERVAEALVRMAPIPPTDHAAFLALKKRAKRLEWKTKPLGFALARLMACAVDGEGTPPGMLPIQPDAAANTHNFIAWRTLSLIDQAATGRGLAPLSAATHRSGFIDPQQMAARTAAYQQAGVRPSASEQAFAQMRLVPDSADAQAATAPQQAVARITFDWHVTSTQPNESGYVFHTLHVVCNGPQPQSTHDHDYAILLCAKHAKTRPLGSDQDASHIRFTASLLPCSLEPFFAEAARPLGNNVDWSEAQWQNHAYIDVLLEPTTAMGPMARLALAVALAGKEPGHTALAVDALVRSVQDGRLDIPAMGDTLARLWATPLVKGPRYAKSLAAAVQAHAAMPAAVFALLCAMVVVQPDTPRKDMAPLLDLLLELQLAHRLPLPADTRTALGAMQLSGKNKTAVKSILA